VSKLLLHVNGLGEARVDLDRDEEKSDEDETQGGCSDDVAVV
jgi:hypothetical protein